MIFKRVVLPRPFALLWESGVETEGDAQRWELSWNRGSSAAEGFFLAVMSVLGWLVQGFLLLEGYVGHDAHHPVAVAIFIFIPGNELTNLALRAVPAPVSKVEEWELLLKSGRRHCSSA